MRLRLQAPDPKFDNARYSLESFPRWRKGKLPEKEVDFRVVLLKKAKLEVMPTFEESAESQRMKNILNQAKAKLPRKQISLDDNDILSI